jgi:hypothetical protein
LNKPGNSYSDDVIKKLKEQGEMEKGNGDTTLLRRSKEDFSKKMRLEPKTQS